MKSETRPRLAEALRMLALRPGDAAEARRAAVLDRIVAGERRTIQVDIAGVIDAAVADGVERRLASARGATHVLVTIDSPGGYVSDATQIFNSLRGHGALVRSVALARCFSAAVLPYLAGDVRSCGPATRFLLHAASITPGKDIARRGTRAEYAALVDRLAAADREVVSILLDRTGAPLAEISREMATEAEMSAGDAVRLGVAHEIGDVMRLDPSLPGRLRALKASGKACVFGASATLWTEQYQQACKLARYR